VNTVNHSIVRIQNMKSTWRLISMVKKEIRKEGGWLG